MIVSDIIDEAVEVTGRPIDALLFKKITRAVHALSNKGNWDPSQQYIDIAVPDNQILILPREVMAPIKININNNAAFSRNRLYEFSLAGPGSGDLVDWQWMDQNGVPLLADLPSTGSKLVVKGDEADNGKTIRFVGLDVNNLELDETITLDGTEQTSEALFRTMRRVRKDLTTKKVVVKTESGDPLANYYADETDPQYRKVKLSKKARFVHILFRAANLEIRTLDDYIPLNSGDAVIFMLKANELAKNAQGAPSAEVEAYEKLAEKRLQEDQSARNSFAALSDADEIQPAFNLNINNRDVIIAADVMDDVIDIFGPVGKYKAFDRITDALELLRNKSHMELQEGYVDLLVGRDGQLTLPRYVHRPVKINFGGEPLQMRNRWFEFHLNGPGSSCNAACRFWDDIGMVVTITDPNEPFQLVAINDIAQDEGKTVRVYGYDEEGKWIRTANEDLESDDKFVDGALIVARYGNSLPDPQTPWFSRISRITRDETDGYQQLIAYGRTTNEPVLVGYYYPDETEPNYSRIKVPSHQWPQEWYSGRLPCPWVRMRYRKRELKVRSFTDPLNMKSRLAVVAALRAIKARSDDVKNAATLELIAENTMKEAEATSNPSLQFSLEVDGVGDWADSEQGQY